MPADLRQAGSPHDVTVDASGRERQPPAVRWLSASARRYCPAVAPAAARRSRARQRSEPVPKAHPELRPSAARRDAAIAAVAPVGWAEWRVEEQPPVERRVRASVRLLEPRWAWRPAAAQVAFRLAELQREKAPRCRVLPERRARSASGLPSAAEPPAPARRPVLVLAGA